MSYLLDTNICSAWIRGDRKIHAKMRQYAGNLYLSTISLSELYVWPYRKDRSTLLFQRIEKLRQEVHILPFDETEAKIFGKVRGEQLCHGISFNTFDLQIAATALAHNLILVTHNIEDFMNVPELHIEDWLE